MAFNFKINICFFKAALGFLKLVNNKMCLKTMV